ncbi:MAG: carbon-nitrogen hydrolase family protein [Candidatus Hodarchaeota archaeon]
MVVKLGMGQMLVIGGDVGRNLFNASKMIKDAAYKGCEIIVLPECLDIGWTNPVATEMATPIPGDYSNQLCVVAKENNIHVVAGLTEREEDDIYNAAVLISNKGEILLKHRKINVLGIAQNLYSTGNSLAVAKTNIQGEEIKIGINICADNFSSSLALGHSLARMGAQMILSPSAWAVDVNHDNSKNPYGGMWKESYLTLTRLYDISVIGVSNVGRIEGGPWDGKICIGNSIAMGPGGELIAEGTNGVDAEELIVIDVEVVKHGVTGTNFAGMLSLGGYNGP